MLLPHVRPHTDTDCVDTTVFLQNFYHLEEEDVGLKIALETRLAPLVLGLKSRMRAAAEQWMGGRKGCLEESGAIFSRLVSVPEVVEIGSGDELGRERIAPDDLPAYAVPHCDKANNYEYDVSGLLYLSSGSGLDFRGGELCFLREEEEEEDVECFLEPRKGRFAVFSSSLDRVNVHRVMRLKSGERHLLSVWWRAAEAEAII